MRVGRHPSPFAQPKLTAAAFGLKGVLHVFFGLGLNERDRGGRSVPNCGKGSQVAFSLALQKVFC